MEHGGKSRKNHGKIMETNIRLVTKTWKQNGIKTWSKTEIPQKNAWLCSPRWGTHKIYQVHSSVEGKWNGDRGCLVDRTIQRRTFFRSILNAKTCQVESLRVRTVRFAVEQTGTRPIRSPPAMLVTANWYEYTWNIISGHVCCKLNKSKVTQFTWSRYDFSVQHCRMANITPIP